MLDPIEELFRDPRLVALASVLIGCYILRDVVRVITALADSATGPAPSTREAGTGAPDEPEGLQEP